MNPGRKLIPKIQIAEDTPHEAGIDLESVPYRALWRGVITQAALEAGGQAMHGVHRRNKPYARDAAVRWLSQASEDLRTVCDLAGLPVPEVMRLARGKFGAVGATRSSGLKRRPSHAVPSTMRNIAESADAGAVGNATEGE